MTRTKIITTVIFIFLAGLIYNYSTHPTILQFLFPTKIWPHRVNSLEKLEELSSKFRGVELDVIWENEHFDVNHPPAPSIGLSLGEYLHKLPDQQLCLWLDYKNLDDTNTFASLNYLDSLVKLNGLKKENFIIESGDPEYLKVFSKRGYKTSYYLPTGVNGKNAKDVINKIGQEYKNSETDFLSTPLGEYVYLKDKFPENQKIIWYLGSYKGFKNKIRIYKALLDDKVRIFLMPVETIAHNR